MTAHQITAVTVSAGFAVIIVAGLTLTSRAEFDRDVRDCLDWLEVEHIVYSSYHEMSLGELDESGDMEDRMMEHPIMSVAWENYNRQARLNFDRYRAYSDISMVALKRKQAYSAILKRDRPRVWSECSDRHEGEADK